MAVEWAAAVAAFGEMIVAAGTEALSVAESVGGGAAEAAPSIADSFTGEVYWKDGVGWQTRFPQPTYDPPPDWSGPSRVIEPEPSRAGSISMSGIGFAPVLPPALAPNMGGGGTPPAPPGTTVAPSTSPTASTPSSPGAPAPALPPLPPHTPPTTPPPAPPASPGAESAPATPTPAPQASSPGGSSTPGRDRSKTRRRKRRAPKRQPTRSPNTPPAAENAPPPRPSPDQPSKEDEQLAEILKRMKRMPHARHQRFGPKVDFRGKEYEETVLLIIRYCLDSTRGTAGQTKGDHAEAAHGRCVWLRTHGQKDSSISIPARDAERFLWGLKGRMTFGPGWPAVKKGYDVLKWSASSESIQTDENPPSARGGEHWTDAGDDWAEQFLEGHEDEPGSIPAPTSAPAAPDHATVP